MGQDEVENQAGYDIIGDIHGHADALRRLLGALGYREGAHGFAHRNRQALFLGDFIDRGPDQRGVLAIVRAMCASGAARAIMGNHELNALAWAMPKPRGGFLRPHTSKNRKQHRAFLEQFEEGSAAYHDALAWFWTLPAWLDLGDLRLVHACWHAASMDLLRPMLDEAGRFTVEGLREAHRKGSPIRAAADIVLKGPEVALPEGVSFHDKDGHERREVRIAWWKEGATTFRSAALGLDGREHELPDTPMSPSYRYEDGIPAFFGHYWLTGEPRLEAQNALCLDTSVAKQGHLSAYRWDPGEALSPANLAWVSADAGG